MSTQPITLVSKVWNDEPLKPRRERLWLAAGKRCHWCGCPTRLHADVFSWDCVTIDHIVPRYKGGANEEFNMASACARCNNRRNHEDMCGLPEGSLLGKWKMDSNVQSTNAGKSKLHPSAPSRDDKKALMARMDNKANLIKETEERLRYQRDQALKRISELEKEVYKWKQTASDLEDKSIGRIIRERIAKRILDRGSRS